MKGVSRETAGYSVNIAANDAKFEERMLQISKRNAKYQKDFSHINSETLAEEWLKELEDLR